MCGPLNIRTLTHAQTPLTGRGGSSEIEPGNKFGKKAERPQ